MWRRRKSVRICSPSAVRSVPSTTTVPDVGGSIPAMTLRSVDFPEPLRPTITAISPLASVTDTSRSTTRSVSPSRYDLLTLRSSRAGRHIFAHSTWDGPACSALYAILRGLEAAAKGGIVEALDTHGGARVAAGRLRRRLEGADGDRAAHVGRGAGVPGALSEH